MGEENISQECRRKEIDESKNYFIEEIKQDELMSNTHKKACKILNYFEHLLILASRVTRCVSISAFASCHIGICKFCSRNKSFGNNYSD